MELLEFLPAFERLSSTRGDEETRIKRLSVSAGPDIGRFHEILYTIRAIYPFDWSSWHHEAERLFHNPATLGSADEMTLRKLLTYHARVDHFNEGHFHEMIECGHIAAILRRLQELRTLPQLGK